MAVSSYGHSDEAKKRKTEADELEGLPRPCPPSPLLNMLWCCHIDDKGQCCMQQPRFWVGKPASVDDYTHACGDHVEDLKGLSDEVRPLSENLPVFNRQVVAVVESSP